MESGNFENIFVFVKLKMLIWVKNVIFMLELLDGVDRWEFKNLLFWIYVKWIVK